MKISCVITNNYDRSMDRDVYERYTELALILHDLPQAELDKLKGTDKGKRYRFVLEELSDNPMTCRHLFDSVDMACIHCGESLPKWTLESPEFFDAVSAIPLPYTISALALDHISTITVSAVEPEADIPLTMERK